MGEACDRAQRGGQDLEEEDARKEHAPICRGCPRPHGRGGAGVGLGGMAAKRRRWRESKECGATERRESNVLSGKMRPAGCRLRTLSAVPVVVLGGGYGWLVCCEKWWSMLASACLPHYFRISQAPALVKQEERKVTPHCHQHTKAHTHPLFSTLPLNRDDSVCRATLAPRKASKFRPPAKVLLRKQHNTTQPPWTST